MVHAMEANGDSQTLAVMSCVLQSQRMTEGVDEEQPSGIHAADSSESRHVVGKREGTSGQHSIASRDQRFSLQGAEKPIRKVSLCS